MRGDMGEASTAEEARRDAVVGAKPGRKPRRTRRTMISANVTPAELEAIQALAERGGYVSIAEYVRAVALTPRAKYDTDYARIAKPLAEIAYRLIRAIDALRRGDMEAGTAAVIEAQRIVAATLSPLRRSHDAQVRRP